MLCHHVGVFPHQSPSPFASISSEIIIFVKQQTGKTLTLKVQLALSLNPSCHFTILPMIMADHLMCCHHSLHLLFYPTASRFLELNLCFTYVNLQVRRVDTIADVKNLIALRDEYPPSSYVLKANGVEPADDELLLNLNVGNAFTFTNEYRI